MSDLYGWLVQQYSGGHFYKGLDEILPEMARPERINYLRWLDLVMMSSKARRNRCHQKINFHARADAVFERLSPWVHRYDNRELKINSSISWPSGKYTLHSMSLGSYPSGSVGRDALNMLDNFETGVLRRKPCKLLTVWLS